MTQTPPEPDQPELPEQPPPEQPATAPEAKPEESAESVARLRRQLESERKARARAESRVTSIEAANQSEAEKASARAREEGRAEGIKSAGVKLAAAEFRAAAAGKLADPSAVVDLLGEDGLRRFVDDEGEPDTDAITAAVEKLAAAAVAAAPPANGKPTPPKVPNGVQPSAAGEDDWIRSVMR
jgi:hypothetical protein